MSAEVIPFPSGRVVRIGARVVPCRLAELVQRMDARIAELSSRPAAPSIDDARLQALAMILAAAMDRAELRRAGGL